MTLEGQDLRAGTSRFLSQGTFLAYKSLMATFFLFWGVWWAEYDEDPKFGAKCTCFMMDVRGGPTAKRVSCTAVVVLYLFLSILLVSLF